MKRPRVRRHPVARAQSQRHPRGHPGCSSLQHGRPSGVRAAGGLLVCGRRSATWRGRRPAGCPALARLLPAAHSFSAWPSSLQAEPPGRPRPGHQCEEETAWGRGHVLHAREWPVSTEPGQPGRRPWSHEGWARVACHTLRAEAPSSAGGRSRKGEPGPQDQAGRANRRHGRSSRPAALACGKVQILTGRGLRSPLILESGGPHPCHPSWHDGHMATLLWLVTLCTWLFNY